MKGELDDPRSTEYTFYRWNPFTKHWERWDHVSNIWYQSFYFVNHNETLELPAAYLELSYEDTWAEPFLED